MTTMLQVYVELILEKKIFLKRYYLVRLNYGLKVKVVIFTIRLFGDFEISF